MKLAGFLSVLDQLREECVRAFGGFGSRVGAVVLLDGKHELEQGGVLNCEADVGRRRRPQLRLEVVSGVLDAGSNLVS